MTTYPSEAPEAAVKLAEKALESDPHYCIRDVCDALARAGWLHDPAEIERLRAQLTASGGA